MLKKISFFLLLIALSISFKNEAQTTLLYEGFESLPLKFTKSTFPASFSSWARTTNLSSVGNYCDSANRFYNDATILTSDLFSTVGYSFVMLSFDHICKVSQFDSGYVEVTNDNGKNWHKISRHKYYFGLDAANGGAFFGSHGKSQAFNAISYVSPWVTTSPPNNTFWKSEAFNVSVFLGDSLGLKNNTSDSCRIRFNLVSGIGSGSTVDYGWLLDEILLIAEICELQKPDAAFSSPQIENNTLKYDTGPFTIFTSLTDTLSGIDTAYLYFQVNNNGWDSVGMKPVFRNPPFWSGDIPKYYGVNDSLVPGDSICYYVVAYDKANPCRNSTKIPATSSMRFCNKFYIVNSVSIPYFDNFEVLNSWSDSTFIGSINPLWQLGDPNVGGFTAFSGTNAWTTNLTGLFPNNAHAYLYSPIFDFSNAVDASLSFMQNRILNEFSGDYLRLEYSINGGPYQILGVNFDSRGEYVEHPNCTTSTWYNSQSTPGNWSKPSNGWEFTTYKLPSIFNNTNSVRFRFLFQSNGFGRYYGVSIDDFSITLPDSVDLSVMEVAYPGNFFKDAGELDSIKVVIRNNGSDTLKNVRLEVSIDTAGGKLLIPTTYNYDLTSSFPAGLPPGNLNSIFLPTHYKIPEGDYVITVTSAETGDVNTENDTAFSAGHFGFVKYTLPVRGNLFSNFDSTTQRWATLPDAKAACGPQPPIRSNHWKRGMPGYGSTNSTHSGSNAWDINLDSAYKINGNEFLYSPFYDLSASNQAYVSFWMNYNTTPQEDGFRLQYRLDNVSSPWTDLVQTIHPTSGAINWFTGRGLSNGQGWSGNSSGWQYAQYPINPKIPTGPAASSVQFRFQFVSDANGGNNMIGVSIDDFSVVNPDSIDIELEKIFPLTRCLNGFEEVNVTIKNNGFTAVDSIPLCFNYGIAGLPSTLTASICDTIYDTIFPGQQMNFTFDSLVNLSVVGKYSFNVWLDLNEDQDSNNDTLKNTIIEIQEGCEIEVRLSTDSVIPSAATWMIVDTTANDTLISYAFSQIGSGVTNWKEVFCLTPGGDYKFIITPSSVNFTSNIRLKNLGLNTVVLNSTQQLSSGFNWDCIPSINVSSVNVNTLSSIELPIEQAYSFQHEIINAGLFPVEKVLITLEVLQNSPVSSVVLLQTDTFNIAAGSAYGLQYLEDSLYTFAGSLNLTPGSYTINSWTSQPNFLVDADPLNDTSRIVLTILDSIGDISSPFCENFDAVGPFSGPKWASLVNDNYLHSQTFEEGTPSQSTISSASTSPNSWATGLSSNYLDLDNSSLYSPLFFVGDTSACYQVSFSHQYKTEYLFDGGKLEYSIDSGKNWVQLGGLLDSLSAANWYNSPFVAALNGTLPSPGWSGNSNSYVQSSHDLNFSGYGKKDFYVIFRFKFASDASTNDEGWSIDDFCFGVGGNCEFYSCFDKVKNGLETGIDCGGPDCYPCPSCSDGLLNGLETGVDCGGPECLPCPTCNDGIKNGLETGIDCGGPECPVCPPTCFDGIMNGQETGIDCGGPECKPCPLPIGIDNFNSGEFALGQNQPNPASGITSIPFNLPSGGKVIIEFRNVLGKLVFSKNIEGKTGQNKFELDVSTWNAGIYFYSFQYEEKTLVDRMSVVE